jgi:hypothetical protein
MNEWISKHFYPLHACDLRAASILSAIEGVSVKAACIAAAGFLSLSSHRWTATCKDLAFHG